MKACLLRNLQIWLIFNMRRENVVASAFNTVYFLKNLNPNVLHKLITAITLNFQAVQKHMMLMVIYALRPSNRLFKSDFFIEICIFVREMFSVILDKRNEL